MSARRLLVLCYFYPPLAGGGVHRVLGFTRHLVPHGWSSTVICAGASDYWVVDDSLAARVPPGVEVVRVPGGSAIAAWLRAGGGGSGRRSGTRFAPLRRAAGWWLLPDSYAGWARRAARVAARRLAGERAAGRPFDAMLSSSPPDSVHLAALGLARAGGPPWVADFRDPWMGLAPGRAPTAWHRARQEALERAVLSGADLVLAASATHAAALEARPDRAARRVVHLPNGYEAEPGEAGPEQAPGAAGGDGYFRIAFTGTLSQMPDAAVFLDALHDLLARRGESRRRVRATLAGPYDTDLADRAVALGLAPGIVDFPGPRPHREAAALQRRADLLLLWKPRGMPAMVPGKLYEYLDAGRPLLAVLDPGDEAARLVERAGGVVVPPGDRAALVAELERHYAAWRAGAPLAARRPEWLDDHRRDRLAARLAALLDERVAAAGPVRT